jgi:hypothetical protein
MIHITFYETYRNVGPDLLAIVLMYVDIKQILTFLTGNVRDYSKAGYSSEYLFKEVFMRLMNFMRVASSSITRVLAHYQPPDPYVYNTPSGMSTPYSRHAISYHRLSVMTSLSMIDLLIETKAETCVPGFAMPPSENSHSIRLHHRLYQMLTKMVPISVKQPFYYVRCKLMHSDNGFMFLPFCILSPYNDTTVNRISL